MMWIVGICSVAGTPVAGCNIPRITPDTGHRSGSPTPTLTSRSVGGSSFIIPVPTSAPRNKAANVTQQSNEIDQSLHGWQARKMRRRGPSSWLASSRSACLVSSFLP
ncbi:hypothetical protein QBC33DRAFT_544012 [Phialemonium atrogriseum]|uniref:Secreted protein n=1 Tax=Phialemonium atrogriseum TaxID=1093897 RepID=A0AAJ0BZ54_9PEZI|nr:uncharacterized protein QBC33DRAFT_544012 [Phialemonium atrogriseum]KAK1765799.1 hypothetical protein QBC33DRAFT_544012 [Phialemonium atrogriseum]